MSHRVPLAGLAAGALLLAAPAAASAVAGTLDAPCYTSVPPSQFATVTVTLTGGTPGGGYVVSATVPGAGTGSAGSADGDFDAAGNATAQITGVAPSGIGPTQGQPITFSVQDFAAAGAPETPIGQALVTNLALSIASSPSSPHAHRRVSVSGAPFAGQKVYGFVTKPSSSHVLRRVSLGTANACGFTTHRVIVAPRSYRSGSYRLYINAGTKLNKAAAIFTRFTITRRIL